VTAVVLGCLALEIVRFDYLTERRENEDVHEDAGGKTNDVSCDAPDELEALVVSGCGYAPD